MLGSAKNTQVNTRTFRVNGLEWRVKGADVMQTVAQKRATRKTCFSVQETDSGHVAYLSNHQRTLISERPRKSCSQRADCSTVKQK